MSYVYSHVVSYLSCLILLINSWRDEVMNDFKKVKLKNKSRIVKNR